MNYPDRHHPCYFLADALTALGSSAEVVRDDRTLGCWGLIVDSKPTVWLIDNRHAHEAAHEDDAARKLLDKGVLVCHAQKPDMQRVGGKWLPLAVTPGYEKPRTLPAKLHDVGFVGYIRDMGRMGAMAHLVRHFAVCSEQRVFGPSAVAVYWQARVGVNVPTGYGTPTAYDSANMRLFEILATGTPLVTSHEDYLAELGLVGGENCITYRDMDALVKGVGYLIDNPEVARNMGSKGAELAHTYTHRAKQVLEWLK